MGEQEMLSLSFVSQQSFFKIFDFGKRGYSIIVAQTNPTQLNSSHVLILLGFCIGKILPYVFGSVS